MTDSGIYKITNIENGKFYIGSSSNIKRRLYLHKWDLKRNTHHSITLQRAWNKHGAEKFIFETICICDVNNLYSIEQSYLDNFKPYNPEIGYNISHSSCGVRGVKRTLEQRKLMSEQRKGKPLFKNNPIAMANKMATVLRGELHHQFGKPLSEEHRKKFDRTGTIPWNKGIPSATRNIPRSEESKKKMSETKHKRMEFNKSCKLTKDQVSKIRLLLESKTLKQKEIALIYNVDPSTISNINRNTRWSNLGE